MDSRQILFNTFPRMVGNPRQFLIYNFNELNRFATLNSGIEDECYCSICSYTENNIPIFSEIFFESDVIDPIPIRKIILWAELHNIPYLVLFSGRAGFHIHLLFDTDMIKQTTIKNMSNLILKETENIDKFDSHVTGDIKRLCRIPNTQRVANGKLWCVPLLRNEIFEINNPDEFKNLATSPRFIDFKIGKRPSIYDFVKEDISENKPTQDIQIAPPKELFFIKDLLRPCVYKALCTPNPRHYFRLTAVIELLNHGLTILQIFRIFEKLNWIDFDHSKTKYQLDRIEEKRRNGELLIPFGKQKLGCTKKCSCMDCVLSGGLSS